MEIAEFTVLIVATGGTTYRILPLEESLAQLKFVPRIGDLLVASPDGQPVPGVDEDDTPLMLKIDMVEVVSVIVDPYAQLAIIMVEEFIEEEPEPPAPKGKVNKPAK